MEKNRFFRKEVPNSTIRRAIIIGAIVLGTNIVNIIATSVYYEKQYSEMKDHLEFLEDSLEAFFNSDPITVEPSKPEGPPVPYVPTDRPFHYEFSAYLKLVY